MLWFYKRSDFQCPVPSIWRFTGAERYVLFREIRMQFERLLQISPEIGASRKW
jgi:hypothetical protein